LNCVVYYPGGVKEVIDNIGAFRKKYKELLIFKN